ncbi:MAG: alpha/beta hydrolase [Gemmatimonadaceae bacterium]
MALAISVGAALAVAGWLMRDPTSHFLARRSSLQRVDTLETSRSAQHIDQVLRLHAANGFAVDLAVRRPPPDSAAPFTRRRLFIILGGHRAGKDAALLFPDTRGTIVAAVEYPFRGNVNAKGMAIVPEVPAIRRAIRDTPPGILLALDYLLAQPDVDPARIELIGASFGAPFATIAAALDSRITRLWVLHGAADPYRLLEHNLERYISFGPLRVITAAVADVLIAGPRYDPAKWIDRVAPRPVVLVNALADERIPPELVHELYASAASPKELHWLPGRHMQRNRREILTALVDTVMALAARDTLAPQAASSASYRPIAR